jgi:RNA polymerase sigma factor (sigma-70 family)
VQDREAHVQETARAGWEGVLEALVTERGDALVRYAYLLCGDADDAADLVQSGLVATFGRLRNGFALERAESYVRRAIASAYLDRGRRATRWRRIAHLQARPESVDSSDGTVDLHLDVRAQLDALSPRERACIVLRYYEDLKVDDIADRLGISAGAVKRYLSDAHAKLADALARHEGDVYDPA